jgi:hypothetical protein
MRFRKLRIAWSVVVGVIFIGALYYYGRRLGTSDELWMGTKRIAIRLEDYAREHSGRFPATLEDADFTSKLDAGDRAAIESLHPEYRQPVGHGTSVIKVLVTRSKWETIAMYSDGNLKSTTIDDAL